MGGKHSECLCQLFVRGRGHLERRLPRAMGNGARNHVIATSAKVMCLWHPRCQLWSVDIATLKFCALTAGAGSQARPTHQRRLFRAVRNDAWLVHECQAPRALHGPLCCLKAGAAKPDCIFSRHSVMPARASRCGSQLCRGSIHQATRQTNLGDAAHFAVAHTLKAAGPSVGRLVQHADSLAVAASLVAEENHQRRRREAAE